MTDPYSVTLSGGAPWGIRISGGREFGTPIILNHIVLNGKAHLGGIKTGETILQINDRHATNLPHLEAQKLIKSTGFSLSLVLDRATGLPDAPSENILPNIDENQNLVLPQDNGSPVLRNRPKSSPSSTRVGNSASQKGQLKNRTVRILRSSSMESLNSPGSPGTNRSPITWGQTAQSSNGSQSHGSGIFTSLCPGPDQNHVPTIPNRTVKHTKMTSIPKLPTAIPNSPKISPKLSTSSSPMLAPSPKLAPRWPSREQNPRHKTSQSSLDFHPSDFEVQLSQRAPSSLDGNNSSSTLKLANDPYQRRIISPAPPSNSIQNWIHGQQNHNSISSLSPPVTMLTGFNTSPPQVQINSPHDQIDFDGDRQTAIDSKSSNSPNGTNCGKCSARLGKQFFTAMNRDWCMECFTCAGCDIRLDTIGYIEENDQPYCNKCYELSCAYPCAKCGKKIVGDIMHALNQKWHMACFCCVICGVTFNDGIFHWVEEKPYCSQCVPGGEDYKNSLSYDDEDNCSIDDGCSLYTTDSLMTNTLSSYNKELHSSQMYDSVFNRSNSRMSNDPRLQSISKRWAKINEISKDYEKHSNITQKLKFHNPLVR